jgi:hypothetical protein
MVEKTQNGIFPRNKKVIEFVLAAGGRSWRGIVCGN